MTSSTGSPGTSDAVCPSGPRPRWTRSRRSGSRAAYVAAAASRSSSSTGIGHDVGRRLAEALAQVGEVPIGVAGGRDPLVDLVQHDVVPGHVLGGELGEHRPRRVPAAHREVEAPVVGHCGPGAVGDVGRGRSSHGCAGRPAPRGRSASAVSPSSRRGRRTRVRMADSTLSAKSPTPRDSKRSYSAAVMTGAGTPSSIAASDRPPALARVGHPAREVAQLAASGPARRRSGRPATSRPPSRAATPRRPRPRRSRTGRPTGRAAAWSPRRPSAGACRRWRA